MRIIGIDCATDPKKVGLARVELQGSACALTHAEVGSSREGLVARIVEWLPTRGGALLALDAPLGWPAALGRTLVTHQAGTAVEPAPNEMFRRTTDRYVKQHSNKQPLDVGADRIARTAHNALTLLEEIRTRTGKTVPLAWSPAVEELAAIEVYPAATLCQHGLPESQYKKPDQGERRRDIVRGLKAKLEIPQPVSSALECNADVLDAAVCILAGVDFLSGRALPPTDLALAKEEGWIWIAGG